ncbi:inactive palmitoleoyl-protein carboxylesterase notum1b [Neolamprologus brichardi]|uniref:inactive palmitoleoyl-protein carboxylesterase notum1b n=1 Tax=Neolamprologus brichardi TaxID=32507 RepID=UPI0003EC2E96|nr:inactive palmitoleoyl-protein carboxylesterase notum1b [Neolamprologus brichardi]
MQSRGVARNSLGLSAVRSCLLLLFIHLSAPVEARRVRGGRAQTRRVQQQQTPPPYRERVEGAESFPLDFTAVEGNMDNFVVQIKNLAQSLYPCSAQKLDQDMKLHFLKNLSVTCNDGSPAGYYIKESKGSKRWLLFLEGGWYCFDSQTCESRYETMRRLMSSTKWPLTRTGRGILSPQPEENPHWWNANMVFIPYCSSDVWSGATPKTDQSKTQCVIAQCVRGLADSGWFLDNKQYKFTDCLDTISCAPTEAIKRGIRYWGGLVPESCRQAHVGEEWNCFFGYKVYPTLKSPVFVAQWLFDEAQLTVDNIHLTGQPIHEGQWRYIQKLGQELRLTLRDVPAMFAPACLSHELITRADWTDIRVKGISLPRALHCWDRSLHHNLHINSSHGHQKHTTPPVRGCLLQLIDSCPWPHCNPSCPTIRDQLTGQEMSVIQFLKHMGFDVQKMAQQQGMEPKKLLGMLNNGN